MTTWGTDEYRQLVALVATYLRPADSVTLDAQNTITPTFTPPLTTAEQATFADLQTMAKFGLSNDLTLSEFQAIKSDLATARAYVSIASPTAAQTTAALKSTIRVIGALLRA